MFGQEEPNPRMRDMEMILRFLTLNEIDFLSSATESVNLVSKMNDFMARHRKETDSQLACYKSLFCETIDIIMTLFGEHVFRTNIQTMQTSQKFYATVFDAIMLATACAKKKGVQLTNNNAAIGKVHDLFENSSFKNACSAHTTDSSAIKARVGAACEVLYGLKYEN